MMKEELRNVDGSDSLHPNRSGDVVVVLRPPYQFDAATFGQTIAFSQFFGQHGYLPRRSTWPAASTCTPPSWPPARASATRIPVAGVRAIDLAPTISFMLDFPGPVNARGKILYYLFKVARAVQGSHHAVHHRFPRATDAVAQAADTLGQPERMRLAAQPS